MKKIVMTIITCIFGGLISGCESRESMNTAESVTTYLLVKESILDENDYEGETRTYEYDGNKLVRERRVLHDNGTTSDFITIDYGVSENYPGGITEHLRYAQAQGAVIGEDSEYDSADRLIRKEIFFDDGNTVVTKYEYISLVDGDMTLAMDENDNVWNIETNIIHYNDNGTTDYTTVWNRLNDDEKDIFGSRRAKETITHREYDRKGNLITKYTDKWRINYKYSRDNLLVEEVCYRDGNMETFFSKSTYEYDNSGNVVYECRYNSGEEKPSGKSRYTYCKYE